MSIHEQIEDAQANDHRIRMLLQDGTAVSGRVVEIQDTSYVLEDDEGTTEMIARSQIEHVLLV
jgi:hypothetical protein